MSMHASSVKELDDAILEDELTLIFVEELDDTLEEELTSIIVELELTSLPLEAGSFALLAGVSLEVGVPLLDSGGTSPLLEELVSELSMAEEFMSPLVGAIRLLSSQPVSARAKIDAVVSPQTMFVNLVFMKPLLLINL